MQEIEQKYATLGQEFIPKKEKHILKPNAKVTFTTIQDPAATGDLFADKQAEMDTL